MKRQVFIFAFLLMVLWPISQPAIGQVGSEESRQKLEQWGRRLNKSLHAEQSVLRQLYTIESELRRQENELAKINSTLTTIRTRAGATEKQIDNLRQDKKARLSRLSGTFRRLYKLGQGGMWQILFESKDLKTFLQRYKTLKFFLQKDVEQVNAFKSRVRHLTAKRADLAKDIATLDRLKNDAVVRSDGVWLERQKRVLLLEQIQRNKALALRATRELELQDEKIAATILEMPDFGPSEPVDPGSLILDFASRKGYLKRPVPGAIISRFGRQTSQRFGTVTKNNGIDVAAGENAQVFAVADGTVSYVGEFLGYGRVLIVDHGDRFHTLYARLDRFLVIKGDSVKAGTPVGTVEKSGTLGEGGLHFEIRHKGIAQDPIEWLDLGGN